jgi:Bacterial protein of unknown function (DUF899)
MELDLHLTIETEDGRRIALSGDGRAASGSGEPTLDIFGNIRLFTADKEYSWVNERQIRSIGTASLATGKIHVEANESDIAQETIAMNTPPIVSPEAWEAARLEMLVKEKALTRARDRLAAERRRMPWLAVEKTYEFEGPRGESSLLDLFEGRRQLIVYRAFFKPGVTGWPDHGWLGCSFGADQVSHLAHLRTRHHPSVAFARASGGHRTPEGADGLGNAMVQHCGQLRR